MIKYLLFWQEFTEVIKRRKRGKNEKEDYLRRAVEYLEKDKDVKEKDETATYAESWALSYRKLSGDQKLFAKRAIDEILILGQLNQLRLNSVISPTCNQTSTPSHSDSPRLSTSSSIPFGYSPSPSTPNNAGFMTPAPANRNVNNGYSNFSHLMQDPQYN